MIELEAVMLDTSPLGRIVHPKPNIDITTLLRSLLEQGTLVYLPEIADYELRRNLILERFNDSIVRLDQLKKTLTYVPISTDIMLQAAEFWAYARREGIPTANKEALDGDAILAAQAKKVGATILTENAGHLTRFVEARNWKELLVG